jgi:excisionase family DNA binding protein
MPATAREPALLTATQTADLLGISPGTVRRAIHDGRLPGVRLGARGRWRIRRDAVESLIGAEPAEAGVDPAPRPPAGDPSARRGPARAEATT